MNVLMNGIDKEIKKVLSNLTKEVDIFSCDKIYLPTNVGNYHWTMIIINVQSREIHYYDSMSKSGKEYTNAVLKLLMKEATRKKKATFDVKQWKVYTQESHVPQQGTNGTECGVFAIMCANFTFDNLPLNYTLEDMVFFRKKIAADILRGSFTYHK